MARKRVAGLDLFPMKLTLSKREMLFLTAVVLKMMAQTISISVIPFMIGEGISTYVFKFMTYSSYLLVLLSFFIDVKITKIEICKIILLVLVTIVGSYYAGTDIMLTLVFIYGLKNIAPEKIVKKAGKIYICIFSIIVFCSVIGIIENWDFFADTDRPRWGLGYTYPTHTSSVFFMAVLLFCYIKRNRITIIWVLCIEGLNIWLFSYTDSRAGMILSAITPVVFWAIKHNRKSKSVIDWLLQWAFPICALLMIFMSLKYDGSGVLNKVNALLSDRLYLSGKALKTYGIHLFGQKIAWIGLGGMGHTQTALSGEYNYVDSSYIRILLDNGALIWSMLIVGWTNTSIKAYKTHNRYLLWTLALLAAYFIIEQWLMNLGANLFLLYLSYNLYNPLKKKNTCYCFGESIM